MSHPLPAATPSMSRTVAIEDLQVGMYVHLDVGWMAHPFPTSSFVVESQRDIERIRSLGLRRLRWAPEKSAPRTTTVIARIDQARESSETVGHTAGSSDGAAETSAQALASQRAALSAQRAAMQRCEQHYGEASSVLRHIVGDVVARPELAREQAQALTRTLFEKMLGEGEMCVLVLSSNAAARPTAHAMNVTIISLLMSRVCGLDESEMMDVGLGAMLHDIGKLSLPRAVHHPGANLGSAEVTAYRDHVRQGCFLGERMGLSAGALQVIAQHHECSDGSGFPAALNIDRMSTAARIVALVNRYDDLCNPAQADEALTPHDALSRLFAQGQGKTDATMLNAFIRMMGVYPAGSLVQLTDDRFAMVTHINSTRPLKPRVLVHEPRVPREDALLLNLADAPDLGIRRSLTATQLPSAARQYLEPVPRVAYYFDHVGAPPVQAPA